MDKTDFFNSSSPVVRDVDLPDGRKVKVKKLSQGESEQLTNDYARDPQKQAAGFRYIACKATVQDDGSRMFDDTDLEKLKGVDADAIKVIADAVIDFSGLKPDAPKKG